MNNKTDWNQDLNVHGVQFYISKQNEISELKRCTEGMIQKYFSNDIKSVDINKVRHPLNGKCFEIGIRFNNPVATTLQQSYDFFHQLDIVSRQVFASYIGWEASMK